MILRASIAAMNLIVGVVSIDAPATSEEKRAFGVAVRKATFNCPIVSDVHFEGTTAESAIVKVTCNDPSSQTFFVPLHYKVIISPDLQVKVEPWR
jgi:hypothetical protein